MGKIEVKYKTMRSNEVEHEINSPIKVNPKVKFNISTSDAAYREIKQFQCSCCGKSWSIQKGHFVASDSVLYQNNNGYTTICNDCRDAYYKQLLDFYSGNSSHAVHHLCRQFDIVYSIDALLAVKHNDIYANGGFGFYLSRKNLGQTAKIGSTYTDGLAWDKIVNGDVIIESKEQVKDEKNLTQAIVDRWGVGFTEMDYKFLDDHYKTLKKNNPNCDNNQEIFIRDLCYTKLLQMKAMRGEGRSDDFEKYTKLYRDTFKQAGLKTVQESDGSADETYGVTLATISQYTPEEYYKDKKLYKDFDGLGKYFTRFVQRPLKNLQFGTTERDKEFYVKDSDRNE